MRHALSHLLAAATALVAAAPVHAQSDVRSRTVAYADLDLSDAGDRATLKRRIDHAVGQVCAVGDARMLSMQLAERRCIAETHERTRPAVEVAMRQGDTRLASVGTGIAVSAR